MTVGLLSLSYSLISMASPPFLELPTEKKRISNFDIEERLDELCDECYARRNPTLCYKCHGELLKYANYCTHCGSKIPESVKEILEGV